MKRNKRFLRPSQAYPKSTPTLPTNCGTSLRDQNATTTTDNSREPKLTIGMAPEFSCWYCEHPLPRRFHALRVEDAKPCPLVLFTCSPRCLDFLLGVYRDGGMKARRLDHAELRPMLDRPELCSNIVERHLIDGKLNVMPYGTGLD